MKEQLRQLLSTLVTGWLLTTLVLSALMLAAGTLATRGAVDLVVVYGHLIVGGLLALFVVPFLLISWFIQKASNPHVVPYMRYHLISAAVSGLLIIGFLVSGLLTKR